MFDLFATTRNTVKAFFFTAVHVEIAVTQLAEGCWRLTKALTQYTSTVKQASRTPSYRWTIPSSLQSSSGGFV
jgi:hypothetical protein